jgi:hypothetical protein
MERLREQAASLIRQKYVVKVDHHQNLYQNRQPAQNASPDFELVDSPQELKKIQDKKMLENILHNIFSPETKMFDKSLCAFLTQYQNACDCIQEKTYQEILSSLQQIEILNDFLMIELNSSAKKISVSDQKFSVLVNIVDFTIKCKY